MNAGNWIGVGLWALAFSAAGYMVWDAVRILRRGKAVMDRSLMVREHELDGQVTAMASDMDRELYRLLYGS